MGSVGNVPKVTASAGEDTFVNVPNRINTLNNDLDGLKTKIKQSSKNDLNALKGEVQKQRRKLNDIQGSLNEINDGTLTSSQQAQASSLQRQIDLANKKCDDLDKAIDKKAIS